MVARSATIDKRGVGQPWEVVNCHNHRPSLLDTTQFVESFIDKFLAVTRKVTHLANTEGRSEEEKTTALRGNRTPGGSTLRAVWWQRPRLPLPH